MFASLHSLARAAALHLIVVAEGERLRITLQPRPLAGDAPVPPPLQLVATPEEFDAGFVEAVRTYQAPATSLIEQATGAAQAVTAAAEEEKSEAVRPAEKVAKKAPAKKAKPAKTPPHIVAAQQRATLERAAAAEKADEPSATAATPEATPGETPAPVDETPAAVDETPAAVDETPAAVDETPAAVGDAPPAAPVPSTLEQQRARAAERKAAKAAQLIAAAKEKLERKRERKAAREAAAAERRAAAQAKRDQAAARRAEKGPGRNASPADIEAARAACLVDARGYLALIGDAKPSRAAFLASMPPTGRRYERLFASWDEFIDAARQQELPIEGDGATSAEAYASAETGAASDVGQTAEPSATPTDTAPASADAPPTDAAAAPSGIPHSPPADTDTSTVSPAAALALQTASQTAEPVTLANMGAPPAQATAGLFSGEPQLDGDGAPIEPDPPLPEKPGHTATGAAVASITLDLI